VAAEQARYNSWSRWLRERWGTTVRKISLDSGTGCPNREGLTRGGCIFCDARGGGSGAFLRDESLENQIRRGFRRLNDSRDDSMAILYFQSYSSTNTTSENFRQTLENSIDLSKTLGKVAGISVGARPDQVPEEILDIMEALGKREASDVWLELGIQTIDPAGLKWLNRGHDLEAIEDAIRRAARRNVFICAHLICGYLNELRGQLGISSRWLTVHGVHALKFHPLHVLSGTLLEKLYLGGKFSPITSEQYVSEVVEALRTISYDTIIQRLSADASPPELVAPEWVSGKPLVISAIREQMRLLGAFQGDSSTFSSGSLCIPKRSEPEEI